MSRKSASILAQHKTRLRYNVESLFLLSKMSGLWNDREIEEIIVELKKKRRIQAASSKKDTNLCAPRFIFVCGKSLECQEDTVRKTTLNKLKSHLTIGEYNNKTNNVLCVISERLYIQDYSDDIFSFEKMLAEISQRIILPAESAGTYCELGAFVMDEDCRSKIIVINEFKEEYRNSFITRGPIKLLDEKNSDNVIYYSGKVDENAEYTDSIERIANEDLRIPINEDKANVSLRSLIYELANIVELFQPLTPYEIELLYKKIKEFDSYTIKSETKIKNIKKVIQFMEDMELIKNDGTNNYSLIDGISCYNVLFTLKRKDFLDLRVRYLNRLSKYRSTGA